MIETRSLEKIPPAAIHRSFSKAFEDYDMPPLSYEELMQMLERRGFSAQHSFGAFDGEELVSFTFNGIGLLNGKQTAYDTGTGTVKAYRGKGLARRVFLDSIPHLIKAGIRQYLLEVLQHNDKAIPLYKSLGFETTREFNYYVFEKQVIKHAKETTTTNVVIDSLDDFDPIKLESFHDFPLSWQNSFDAVDRRRDDFVILGAFVENELAGYGITDPSTGDITQIAVDKAHRRKGIGTRILLELLKKNSRDQLKIINTETGCESMDGFLGSLGIELSGQQFEMIKVLD